MWMWNNSEILDSSQMKASFSPDIKKKNIFIRVAYLWQISAEFPGLSSKGDAGFDTVVLAWSS